MSTSQAALFLGIAFACACANADDSEFACPIGASEVKGAPIETAESKALRVNTALWCEVNGEKHGPYSDYYESGQLQSQINFRYGERHGIARKYHGNGQLRSEFAFKDGQPYGEGKKWNRRGRLVQRSQIETRNGELHSYTRTYQETGKLGVEGALIDGKKDGLWIMYNKEGEKESVRLWDRGRFVEQLDHR